MASKQERGFAAMNPEKQRMIARKGGEAVARNRQHMAEIGRKGGESVSRNRDHMAQIGREGGKNSHGVRENNHSSMDGHTSMDLNMHSNEERFGE